MMDATTQATQQGEFDTAFHMVAPPAAPKPMDPLPYYPNTKYVEKNLAPEKALTYYDVASLAAARKQAEETGVLTPELGAQMLPMAMVEGRSGNFGIRHDNGFNPTPTTLARFKKMGLSITDMTDPAEQEARTFAVAKQNPETGQLDYFKQVPGFHPNPEGTNKPILSPMAPPPALGDMVIRHTNTGGKMLYIGDMTDDPDRYARAMAAILAEKAAVDKTKTVDGTVKLYNGYGKGAELDEGKVVPADTDVYLAKVNAARAMIDHPFNAALKSHFDSVYKKAK